MELGLAGKNVLITGGSKGIGKACARLFANEGANVTICARNPATIEEALVEIDAAGRGAVAGFPGDMTRWDDVRRVVDQAIEAMGSIDVLVTCAGSSPGGLIEELTEEIRPLNAIISSSVMVNCCPAMLCPP